jgi:branched-chain amino acid transport system substrate-binding protein
MSSKMYQWLMVMMFVLISACPVTAADPVRIGALFSVTGPPSFLGEPERNTAQMVAEELNKTGGIAGRKIHLVVYDTQGDPTKANQAATRLIKTTRWLPSSVRAAR